MNQIHWNRYINFIYSRRYRIIPKGIYIENHHIIPKSLNGEDKGNIIKLTAREHFIAHLILWKCLGGKMSRAFWYMIHIKNKEKLTSRQYEVLRKNAGKYQSNLISGKNHPMYGRHHSEETKKKIGDRYYPTKEEHYSYQKPFSEEHKKKLRENRPDINGDKNPFYRHTHSKEVKQKLSKNRKGKTWEEVFGEDKAKQAKEKISKATSKRMKGNKLYLQITDEGKKSFTKKMKGRIRIYKKDEQKSIYKEELEIYEKEGWIKGKITKQCSYCDRKIDAANMSRHINCNHKEKVA